MIKSTKKSPFTATIHDLRRLHCTSLETVAMTMKHPRSLARNTASWRPPTIHMPAKSAVDPIAITVTRHRVGHLARARIRGYGESRTPAYMIAIRLTSPEGRTIGKTEAETWARALLPDSGRFSVHRIDGLGAPTFCWIVDQHFIPIESPASLFESQRSAA